MTVKELYEKISLSVPETLREEWDNDGIMCSADMSAEVKRVLLSLDVTEEIVDYAIERSYDLIISHHPLVFRPICAVNETNNVSRKIIKLINNGISVFSFHTRADKVRGGVNDCLAKILGLNNTVPFGEGGMGRVGYLNAELEFDVFAEQVKSSLGADNIRIANGYNTVKKVAVLGGDGKDFVLDAIKTGADTYVSGRISYNLMEEAAELGINLVEAGHYFTEAPVLNFFAELISAADISVTVDFADSNMIEII